MPPRTTSKTTEENVALRARMAKLEDQLANSDSVKKTLPEGKLAHEGRIENDLRTSEARYRRLFETAKDGILLL